MTPKNTAPINPGNRPPRKTFKDLIVWQKAIDLAPKIYRLTQKLPKEEAFALGAQLRRSVVLVASSIAEGQILGHRRDFAHHLHLAQGSLAEVHTQLLIAQRLEYFPGSEITALESNLEDISKLLGGLIYKLETNDAPERREFSPS